MARPEKQAESSAIRSRIVLEVAAELVTASEQPMRQAKVLLRERGSGADWPLRLHGSSTIEGIHEVARGETLLAIVNPAAMLALALHGAAPFDEALPVRQIAVIPSEDQLVLAVRPETGLTRFEDIAEKRPSLRLALRGQTDHSIHYMLDGIMRAAGFSLADIERWGGAIRREGGVPKLGTRKFKDVVSGTLDAVFDEGASSWINAALAAGLTVLPLAEATVRTLEAQGYRRAVLRRSVYSSLARDVLTIDFSGWPIFTHAGAPDALVRHICEALVARKHLMPWDGPGDLPIERMARDAPDTPQLVPLHPAAERYWRERGWLD
ncbi:MAG TPA: TAXI family TRAP transporter solute-binding subunit [Alphaproteobacteria bacterium]|nr:TAXI family TRAP transporter solute-binding subunit [Alphaproteobacteria bacterium]